MTLSLCPFAPGDLADAIALAKRYYADDGHAFDDVIQPRGIKMLCDGTPFGRGYFINQGPERIGYAVIALGFSIEVGGLDCFFDEFFIEPAHRGQGHGKAALALIEEEIRRLGGRRLCLEVMPANRRADGLYRAAGYQPHDRGLLSKEL